MLALPRHPAPGQDHVGGLFLRGRQQLRDAPTQPGRSAAGHSTEAWLLPGDRAIFSSITGHHMEDRGWKRIGEWKNSLENTQVVKARGKLY